MVFAAVHSLNPGGYYMEISRERFKQIDSVVFAFLDEQPHETKITEEEFWKRVRRNTVYRNYSVDMLNKKNRTLSLSITDLVAYITQKQQEAEKAKEDFLTSACR